jgi:hypothetical protein
MSARRASSPRAKKTVMLHSATAVRRTLRWSPVFALLVTVAPTQAVVHPPHYTRAEASDANVLPFGWTAVPIRMIQIHEGLPTGTIRGMTFRIDAGQANNLAAFQAVVEVQMSSALTTAALPNATFNLNHGTDRTTVMPATVVNMVPAPIALAPRPFLHGVTFPTPFSRTGSGPLCWDMTISNRSAPFNLEFDHATTNANPPATVLPFGTGCRLVGAAGPMTLASAASLNWAAGSALFRFSGTRLPVNSVVILSTGTSNTNFAGLPLPFELPGSATSPSGPCTIYNDSLLQLPVFTTASGTLATNTSLTLNIHRSMNGASLFTQLIAIDPPANPFGVTTSNSVQLHLSAPFTNNSLSRIWVSGNLVPTGRVDVGYGAVTRFDY